VAISDSTASLAKLLSQELIKPAHGIMQNAYVTSYDIHV